MKTAHLGLLAAGLLALLCGAAFAADTQPTAAAMPLIKGAADIEQAPPEIQALLTDPQWNQPYIQPENTSVRLDLLDADGNPVGASSDGRWKLQGLDLARGGWLTRWRLAPTKADGELPQAKYIFWAWRDGTIQYNAQPYAETPALVKKLYKPDPQRDAPIYVVRVLIVDRDGNRTFADALPLQLTK